MLLSFLQWFRGPRQFDDAYLENERTNGVDFHYVEMWLRSLPRGRYTLCEEMRSGELITHLTDVDVEELHEYCRMVYIPSVPPKFVVRRT